MNRIEMIEQREIERLIVDILAEQAEQDVWDIGFYELLREIKSMIPDIDQEDLEYYLNKLVHKEFVKLSSGRVALVPIGRMI